MASTGLRDLLWRVARRLPRRWGVPLLARLAAPRRDTAHHTQVAVPAPFRLDVYLLTDHDGDRGPSASLWLDGEELLRLDCLSQRPHLHYALAESRWLGANGRAVALPPGTVDDTIDRAAFELENNLGWCLAMSYRRSHRRLAANLDQDAFAAAATEMAAAMRRLRRHVDA